MKNRGGKRTRKRQQKYQNRKSDGISRQGNDSVNVNLSQFQATSAGTYITIASGKFIYFSSMQASKLPPWDPKRSPSACKQTYKFITYNTFQENSTFFVVMLINFIRISIFSKNDNDIMVYCCIFAIFAIYKFSIMIFIHNFFFFKLFIQLFRIIIFLLRQFLVILCIQQKNFEVLFRNFQNLKLF